MTDKENGAVVVSALYQFFRFDNYTEYQEPLLAAMQNLHVKGTLLLAKEGINGTIAGSESGVSKIIAMLEDISKCGAFEIKSSKSQKTPFLRSRVKIKKEIVTMGVDAVDPEKEVGTYVSPGEWNELITRDDVLLIDTRNDYEVKTGSFKGAVNPGTASFRQFPEYIEKHLADKKNKKIAMFCTGGIRCEKSTSYLKRLGFQHVYHLKGGILKYLEQVEKDESLWQGECFVFDDRVTVDHNLKPGSYDQCHACRRPISQIDKMSPHYQRGASCPHCISETSVSQRTRFLEREKQIQLAKKRGEKHLGLSPEELAKKKAF